MCAYSTGAKVINYCSAMTVILTLCPVLLVSSWFCFLGLQEINTRLVLIPVPEKHYPCMLIQVRMLSAVRVAPCMRTHVSYVKHANALYTPHGAPLLLCLRCKCSNVMLSVFFSKYIQLKIHSKGYMTIAKMLIC